MTQNMNQMAYQNNELNFPTLQRYQIDGDTYDQMRETVRLIADAIVDGSRYLPIRNRAAALATTAKPKDYFGQVAAIYNDFVKRWRYVKDPVGKELVTRSPKQIFELVMGGKSSSPGVGLGYGAGDCDDATVAIGSMLASIGMPVRIATMAPVNAPPGNLMSHVFAQALVPNVGWVTVDPVVWPSHGLGYTPPYSRIAFFDLTGKLLQTHGNAINMAGYENLNGEKKMELIPSINGFEDYAGLGDYSEGDIMDFRNVISGFGAFSETMGILDLGDAGMGLGAEVETDERGLAWAPIIEVAPRDYNFVRAAGAPYHGMLGLGDNGLAYTWDQNLGFFKKLFRKIKHGVKKVVRGVARVAKKVIKKIPGGKYLLKLGEKVWKVSKKLLKPLAKWVGPLAKKLAPIAALIPGYGPAISAALATTGKIADIMNKYGVKVVEKVGKIGKLKFPSDKVAKKFQKELKHAAEKQKKSGKTKSQLAQHRKASLAKRRAQPMNAMAMKMRPAAMRRNPIAMRRRAPKNLLGSFQARTPAALQARHAMIRRFRPAALR